jgi:hypothetical protein
LVDTIFAAKPFATALAKTQWRKSDADCRIKTGQGDSSYDPSAQRLILKVLRGLAEQCRQIELDGADRLISRMVQRFEKRDSFTPRDVIECQSAIEMIIHELSSRRFAYVPVEKAKVLGAIEAGWRPIWRRFQSVEEDSKEAVYCYALGRNNACVFHSMMALERGLEALAKRLKVQYDRRSWQPIFDDIERAIVKHRKAQGPKGIPAKRRRAARLTFYAEAAKEFSYFKDAWRNHTAHGRAHYDEQDAAKIMSHVRDFMLHLATELKE